MEAIVHRPANSCLPLRIANQAGWMLLNTHRISATWNGGRNRGDVLITSQPDGDLCPAISHFGDGIITWMIPYLFRTSPGFNLLVRGPANLPKDGIQPLEGIVETDSALAPFTMNWKFTRPDTAVAFAVDEPICMLVPQRRGDVEAFHASMRHLRDDPEMLNGVSLWRAQRSAALMSMDELVKTSDPASEPPRPPIQKDYLRGLLPTGEPMPDHQLRLRVRDFEVVEPGPDPPDDGEIASE